MIQYGNEASRPQQGFEDIDLYFDESSAHDNHQQVQENIIDVRIIKFTNDIFISQHGSSYAYHGIGQKLTLADCGRSFTRLAPLDKKTPSDWTHVPQPNHRNAEEKSMLLLDITNSKITFTTNGIYNRIYEFDIEKNDGNWAPTCDFINFLYKLWRLQILTTSPCY
ncbi:MAG TPA: hypothetical protein VGP47_05010 [Parachlamydiaceae bacterium]|nr:hypothetical protein [Parachlamydiaceae bacterium]